MPCASFSMLDDPCGTGCGEVCFPVHGCWDSRDVGVVGVFDCVKECMGFGCPLMKVSLSNSA